MAKEPNITVDEMIRVGACPSGMRRWYTERKADIPTGWDLRRFLDEGLPVEIARQLDDHFFNAALARRELPE